MTPQGRDAPFAVVHMGILRCSSPPIPVLRFAGASRAPGGGGRG